MSLSRRRIASFLAAGTAAATITACGTDGKVAQPTTRPAPAVAAPFQSDELEIGIACGEKLDPSSVTFSNGQLTFRDADIAVSTRGSDINLSLNPLRGNLKVTRGEVNNSNGQTITSSASTLEFASKVSPSTFTIRTQGDGISANATLETPDGHAQTAAYQLDPDTASANIVNVRGEFDAETGVNGSTLRQARPGEQIHSEDGKISIASVSSDDGTCIAAVVRTTSSGKTIER